jgi:hypothetical protein
MKKQILIGWSSIGLLALYFLVLTSPTLFAQHNPIPTGPLAPVLLLWMVLVDSVFRPLGHPLADVLAAIVLLAPVFFLLFLAWRNPWGYTRKILAILFTILFLIVAVIVAHN